MLITFEDWSKPEEKVNVDRLNVSDAARYLGERLLTELVTRPIPEASQGLPGTKQSITIETGDHQQIALNVEEQGTVRFTCQCGQSMVFNDLPTEEGELLIPIPVLNAAAEMHADYVLRGGR